MDTRAHVRLVMVGPLPPPVNGQSVVMSHMVRHMASQFPGLRVADDGAGRSSGLLGIAVKIGRSLGGVWAVRRARVAYIAVKADRGMWLTSLTVAAARLVGARILLHHHSYAYVRERTRRMVALTRIAGPNARHVVLAHVMDRDLRRQLPEVRHTVVIDNAALVDDVLTRVPLRDDGAERVLGHLSNLHLDKGIAEVVDLAIALHEAGSPSRLVVGGPVVDGESRRHLERAADALGPHFDYRGPLDGESKCSFFADITHFVFPSRYVHEAVPLVLYEAMAAGAVCVATDHGAIAEQLAGSPAVVVDDIEAFVDQTLPVLLTRTTSRSDSRAARDAYLDARRIAQDQLDGLTDLIARTSS